MDRRSLMWGAGALAGGLALAGRAAASAFEAKIPFAVTRNHVWTGVMLDDQGPFPFLIDTGAVWYMVDPAVAKQVGLAPTGERYKVHTASGTSLQPVFHLRRIAIANKMSDNNLTIVGLREDRNDITKGVIPLSDKAVQSFDFDAKILTVQRDLARIPDGYQSFGLLNARGASGDNLRTGTPGDEGGVGALEATRLRHTLISRQPVIEARLDGQPIRLMVDTGEGGGLLIYPPYVRAHGLWDRYPKFLPATEHGLTGDVKTRTVRAERLAFGTFGFDRPVVTLADPTGTADAYRIADGVIGVEMVRRMNFIVDPDRRVAAFAPNGAFDQIWRYDRAGMTVGVVNQAIEITDVIEDGPAWRAGLRKGYRVTGWAGADKAPGSSPYFGLLWALQGKAGSEVGVQIEVGGRTEVVGVVLEDRL